VTGLAGSEANTAAAAPALRGRHIIGAVAGNTLEFYDFLTYAFFAIQIGRAFFPSHSEFASLMLSLVAFGAGFVTRPIGAFAIGLYADRAGRRAAMILSFSLMGGAVIAFALIPPFSIIGIAAPVLAVLARLVQGFSLGGEVGPSTAFLAEAASPKRRGLVVAFQGASQELASVAGVGVGLILSGLLPQAAVDAYGWRIAFLLGGLALPLGLWLRRTLPETLHLADIPGLPGRTAPHSLTGAAASARPSVRIIILGLMVIGGGTIGTYVVNYMTTFAQGSLHLTGGVVFLATLAPSAASVVGVICGGWLSDRVGRRPVMILPEAALAIMIVPVFHWIVTTRSMAALVVGGAGLGLAGSMSVGAFFPAFAESLPRPVRGRSVATVYAAAIVVFGGTTQLMVTWLIHRTGSPMAPAFYWLAGSLAALSAKVMIPESAPVRLSQQALLAL
jgi:MFS family permease